MKRSIQPFFTVGEYGPGMTPDPMLGRSVQVRSPAGIVYYGVVRSIRDGDGLGELFELGADGVSSRGYQRLVYVTDRAAQVSELDAGD